MQSLSHKLILKLRSILLENSQRHSKKLSMQSLSHRLISENNRKNMSCKQPYHVFSNNISNLNPSDPHYLLP